MRRRTIGGLLLTLVVALVVLPSRSQASPPPPQAQYFKETGHSAQNWYWQFWKNTPDALRVLGYPISEPFVEESFTEPGKFYRVQYYERAVLEEHPENFGKDNNKFYILGRLLGNELIKNRLGEAPFQSVPSISDTANQRYFSETGHTLRNDATKGPFLSFWNKYGGLPVFGFPKSELFQEKNPDTGETYWVQYFERNRFEFHPSEKADFQVLLGRLGAQYQVDNPTTVDKRPFNYRQPSDSLPEAFVYGANIAGFYTDHDRVMTLVNNAFKANNYSGGPAWIRQQVPWKDTETADHRLVPGDLDAIVDSAHAAGVNVFLSVVAAPSWATSDGKNGMPSPNHFGDFASFLSRLAQRYQGKVQAFEIWNEQNYAVENGGNVKPASYYVDMLGAAYDALKAVDQNIIVVAGAPTPTATNRVDIAVDDLAYFDQMFSNQKFWDKSDVVGAHFSGTLNPPDAYAPNGPGPGWQGNSEFYFTRAEELHQHMISSGHGDRQVWLTEFGWATKNVTPGYEYGQYNSLDQQAQYVKRALLRGRFDYAPWIGGMFVWNLNFSVTAGQSFDLQDQSSGFSILNADWSPRPAYSAIQNMPKP
ncbi:MAG: cellulase family glycosylhydrolase [Herpetosiphonaceae bacterium]|nr:cellulase family glycosylhydrolase [Herpetosiphonaceae bacterium]